MKHASLGAAASRYMDRVSDHEVADFTITLHAARQAIAIGDQLRDARKLAGKTVRDVAALSGVGTSTVSRLERGNPDVRIDGLRRVASVLGLRLSIDI